MDSKVYNYTCIEFYMRLKNIRKLLNQISWRKSELINSFMKTSQNQWKSRACNEKLNWIFNVFIKKFRNDI